jgi:hypothetical protein
VAINIKPSHKGLLTRKAKRAGESLSKFESKNKNSKSAATRKQIVFAENAKKWNHKGKKKHNPFKDIGK